ncbi:MAG: glycosyltransferase family 2 protein [Myxococcota bacterium]
MSDPQTLELSVLLPCYNERDNLESLTRELLATLQKTGLDYEILFIDDASTDGSAALLDELARAHPRLRVVHHRHNAGESAAQATGFRAARGERLVTMDSDGQNDPVDLPRFLETLESADVVCGVREVREDDWLRRISSRLANGFRNRVTGDRVLDAGCTYRAIRRRVVRELPVFNGMHRFLPTLARAQGFRVSEIPVHHRPRTAGESKYGVGNRLWRGIVDCLAIRWWRDRAISAGRLPEEIR